MNKVEQIFGSLTSQRIRRGTVDDHNADPKPFKWVKTADEILRKVAKIRMIFQTLH